MASVRRPEISSSSGHPTCADGRLRNSTTNQAGGAYYGGKVRFEFHPVIVRTGWRRRALTLGVDLDILTGAYGAVSDSGNGTGTVAVNSFGISPRAFIGYTAF